MQFLNLKAQYNSIKKEIDQAIKNVIQSSRFIMGPEVEKLEKNVAKYCDTKYGIALNSGTDALFLSLKTLRIKPDDEVITTPFSFIATAEVIANLGAKPVFVDIDSKTFNIDPEKIEERITKKTKAIILVHLFGQMAEMNEIMRIAKKQNLKVIEDACQAIGAKYQIKVNQKSQWLKAGSIGNIGCFSFFPSKNLGAYGDGGMVVTNNKQLASKIKLLKNHGSSKKDKYLNLTPGFNSRLDSIQAAVLNVKLKHLDKWTKARQKNAEYYNKHLKNINEIITPIIPSYAFHVFNQYTIRAKKRNKLQTHLKKYDIPTQIYYPYPLHLQPAFKYLKYKKGDLPETEKSCEEVLSLPIYPELSKKQQDYIIKKIKEFYEKII